MTLEEKHQFSLLKTAVLNKFREHYSTEDAIKNWNGETIVRFQESLLEIVKGRVSEKWFYTYFKNETSKLPRIDMLNLLSRYVGFDNWSKFKTHHPLNLKPQTKVSAYWLITLIPLIVFLVMRMFADNVYNICFVDNLSNEPITQSQIDIKLLKQEQSPIYFKTDRAGCFNYETPDDKIKFIVSSPYHKTDTIISSIDSNHQMVHLRSDDYALILKYYTNGNIKDWTTHKAKLEGLIDDDARIYKFYENNIGVEIYSKDDFIRLLTVPTTSLKKIKILDKSYKNGKIITLKFSLQ